MFQADEKRLCSGCTACYHICPTNAIVMQVDEEGFEYPYIDKSLCVECKLCKEVCAFNDNYDKSMLLDIPEFFGVKIKDEHERRSSRSGGMFVAVSDYIFHLGGVVYGAGFDEKLNVCHKRIENKNDRVGLKGSKYVQSKLAFVFQDIMDDLLKEKYILFVGTACQVAGLNSFLKSKHIKTEKLILCDLVCLGVPSPLIYLKYLQFLEDKYHKRIVKVDFRDKSYGWNTHVESFWFEDGTKISTQEYMQLFYSSKIMRPCCANCYYTNFQRTGDITLADFWGSEHYDGEFDDNKGVSLIFINTEKGKSIFREVRNQIDCFQLPENAKFPEHPALYQSGKDSEEREVFWKDFNERSFKYVLKRHAGYMTKLEKIFLRLKILIKNRLYK